jgi:hypothetical protein
MKFISRIFFPSIIIISIAVFSCAQPKVEKPKEDNTQSSYEGFWNRKGTIQIVNGIPVDTILIKDSNNPNYKQVKVFVDGNMVWLNNNKDSLLPWKGSSGGYGKFKINSETSITETISHGTGWFGAYIKNHKDSLNVPGMVFNLTTDLNGDEYSQKNSPDSKFMEYWERSPKLAPKSKIDGAWKRVYEIAYINDVPVDTVSVASDVILDVKILSNGRYSYQVDQTQYAEEDSELFGGFGGYGTYEFDEENNILKEYQEWGSGMNLSENEPKASLDQHTITFYSSDMFLQVSRTSIGVLEDKNATGRGVVYQRIQ